MDCSPPGSSVLEISQAIILEWVAISFSRGSSQPRDGTCVSYIADGYFITEPPRKTLKIQIVSYKLINLYTYCQLFYLLQGSRWGNSGNSVSLFLGGGSKITADCDCSHEIKRHLLLGRKVMTNLDSILKNRDITLPTKISLVKAIVFPVVIVWM